MAVDQVIKKQNSSKINVTGDILVRIRTSGQRIRIITRMQIRLRIWIRTKTFSDLECEKNQFFHIFRCFNLINEFKRFKIVKICLMIKRKLLVRKFLYHFSPLNTFKGKGKDQDPHPPPDPLVTKKRISMRIREAQKHMDPTDPDPEHCPK